MDEHSGGDHVRGKAVEIPLGQTHDDFLSAEVGDHTDWKSFTLPDPATLTIDAYWDDPSIHATIQVRDQFAGRVFELKHEPGQTKDHWPNMRMREGQYYLEVVATRGSSVYTLEIQSSAASGRDARPSGSVAPPE